MKNNGLLIAFACALVIGLVLIVFIWSVVPRQYVTTDLADYGNYVGNYDNQSVQKFITSFFPKEIQENFFNVTYSYRAQKNDAYAFEAYLEFTIENVREYEEFIEQNTSGLENKEFYYDESYTEYVISDEFYPTNDTEENNNPQENADIHIQSAKIGKILCSKEDQRIIYIALGVYDGGISTTDFLSVYFNRFHINPREYNKGQGAALSPCPAMSR